MKTYINLFVLVSISLTTLLLSQSGRLQRHTEDEVEPVYKQFPQTAARSRKTHPHRIECDRYNTLAGSNVTIVGPFTPGTLNLTLTWEDGTTVLAYIVEAR